MGRSYTPYVGGRWFACWESLPRSVGLLIVPCLLWGVDVRAQESLDQKYAALVREYAERTREATADIARQRQEALRGLAAEGELAPEKDHRTLATIYSSLGEYDRVAEHAAAALEAAPGEESLHGQYVSALVQLRQYDRAEEALREALRRFPQSATLAAQALSVDRSIIYALISRDQVDEAQQRLEATKERLAQWRAQFPGNASFSDNAERSLADLAARIQTTRQRLALVGQPAFPLEGARWVNGSPLTSAELPGKVVLLDFFAVWCGPCIATFPHLRRWHEELGPEGLVIVGVTRPYEYGWNEATGRPEKRPGIAADEEDAALARFAQHHQLGHRMAVMPNSDFGQQYLVTAIPQAAVIDRQGKIRLIRVGSGSESAADLEAMIRQCLSEGRTAAVPGN